MKRQIVFMWVLFLVFFQADCATTLLAQGNEEGMDDGSQWSLGVGAQYETNLYKGADDEITPLPLISYHGERFFIEGLTAGLRLFEWNDLEVSVIGQYEGEGYDPDDSVFLRGMEKRRGTVEAGVTLEWEIPYGELELEAVSDVLGRHKGQQVDLEYGFEIGWEKFTLEPYMGINWQSKKFADYYYGVKAKEVRLNRQAYKVGSVINPVIGLGMSYFFSEHWMIMGDVSYEMLDNKIEKSPIVEASSLTSCFFGLCYAF